MVLVALLDIAERELVDLSILEQHVEQSFVAIFRPLGEQLLRPYLIDLEAPGELHQLPEVRAALAGRIDKLVPELGTSFGVAVSALLFDPHRGREDEIGRQRRDRRIGVRDDDEIVWVAIAGQAFLIAVRARLYVV